MRWFKHLTSARLDQGMQDLIEECGPEGYGVYWIIIELIGAQLTKENDPEYRLTLRNWANFCSVTPKKFTKICRILEKNGNILTENGDKFITIKCPKMVKYRDEYTSRKN